MPQFSIKNARASELLDEVTRISGEGKTEAVIHALERYRADLLAQRDVADVLASIRKRVHARIDPRYLGAAPSKEEIEAELGMPE